MIESCNIGHHTDFRFKILDYIFLRIWTFATRIKLNFLCSTTNSNIPEYKKQSFKGGVNNEYY